jgi:hypothetical protein
MNLYEVFSLASIVLTIVAYAPYIGGILHGGFRPHFFSWLIWSLTTTIVFLAQLSADGGAGAWPTGASALITIYVTWLAWVRRTDISITPADRVFLLGSLASLPVWLITDDPLWSVVILTVVDTLGFGPTLRKVWTHPREESLQFYFLFVIRSALSVVALESRNLTTLLFPVTMMLACGAVCMLLWWRRRWLLQAVGK